MDVLTQLRELCRTNPTSLSELCSSLPSFYGKGRRSVGLTVSLESKTLTDSCTLGPKGVVDALESHQYIGDTRG